MLNDIIKGDCLEVMKEIDDKSIDMILCDLPYGTTKNTWDSIIDLNLLWEQYKRVIKDNGAIVLTAQTPFDKLLGSSNLKMLKYEWIFVKSKSTGFLNSKRMPLKKHENVLIFYKKTPTYNPQMTYGHEPYKEKKNKIVSKNYGPGVGLRRESKGDRYPVSVLNFKSEQKTVHPTQKPLSLFEYLIRTYTNEGDVVLDNCIGSGTTAIACMNTNRSFIGIEKDEEYFLLAKKRIESHNKDNQRG